MHAFRIIDANYNRASEGLRVVEDYARFVLADAHLSESLKRLRHDLASLISQIPLDQLLAARDTAADVGTSIATEGEYRRSELIDVVRANLQRVAQSLRTIEEYAKTLDDPIAPGVEAIRYRVYTLEKAMSRTVFGRQQLAGACLYVLLDGRSTLAEFTSLAEQIAAAGVDVIQLRDKSLADRELLARAETLRRITEQAERRVLFVVNDRPDLALLSRADGVHVGQNELPVQAVRQIVGPGMLIGVSTHNLDQARQAVLDGADYLGCGPTFPSETKSFDSFPGPSFLREVAAEISLPAFAIGGINVENVDQVLATGMARVAMSSGILSARNPATATSEMRKKMGKPSSE
jgi:thiamine-phosphate pyrophosphorylase